MIVELLASEGNHQCAVCVVNGHCDLQDLAYEVGLDHVRFPYLFPKKALDATHKDFIMDRNRCVLCTRCVRVCHEVEAAHVWDIAGRGIHCEIIADLNQPWAHLQAVRPVENVSVYARQALCLRRELQSEKWKRNADLLNLSSMHGRNVSGSA